MQIIIDEALERAQNREEVEKEQIIHDLLYGDPSVFCTRVTAYDVEGVWVQVPDNNIELVTKSQLDKRREEELKKRKPLIDPEIIDGKDIIEIKKIFNKIRNDYTREPFWPVNWFEAVAVTWPYTNITHVVLCAFGMYKISKKYHTVYIRNQKYTLNIYEMFLLVDQLQGIEKLPNDVPLAYDYEELYAEKKVDIKPNYMLYKNTVYKLSEEVKDWLYVTAVRVPIKIKVGEAGDCKAKGIHPQIWTPYLCDDENWHSLCIGDFRKKHWRYVYDHIEEILQIANFDSAYQETWYLNEDDDIEGFSVNDLLEHATKVGFSEPEVRT